MQEESGGRVNGMGIVPWWDRDTAIAEIERIHGLGLHGVNTNADPQNQGMPDLSDPYFQPMWEACADLGLPVNFHIGASVSQASYSGTSPWPSLNNDMKLALGSSMLYIGNARIIANLIYSGVLDRNPELKVVSVESGIGWIPFILDALDYQAVENNPVDEAVGVLQAPDVRVLLVRERWRAARRHRANRRGQLHVRDRFPASHLPLPAAVQRDRRDVRRARRGLAGT